MIARLVVIAYPIADVVVLAMVVRLLIGAGSRRTSFLLMVSASIALLAADIGWAVAYQLGAGPAYVRDHLLDLTLLVAYALFGAAALHPSVREVAVEAWTTSVARLSPWLLALLTTASLIAPCVLLVGGLQRSGHPDGVAIAVCSVALFLLVLTRMAQLVRQVEAHAGHLRELARVDEVTGLPHRRADVALYAAKSAGRDRLVSAELRADPEMARISLRP